MQHKKFFLMQNSFTSDYYGFSFSEGCVMSQENNLLLFLEFLRCVPLFYFNQALICFR